MRSARGIGLGFALGLWLGLVSPASAEGWVAALCALRASPGSAGDPAVSLPERIAAARMLGSYGPDREATPALLRALAGDPQPALRDAILFALARRAPRAAEPQLLALLARDGAVSPALASALSAIGSQSALRALVASLGRGQPAAIEQALRTAERAAIAPLVAALSGPLAVASAHALGGMEPGVADAAEPALLRALASPSPALRAAAAAALGQIGRASSSAALLARARDPEPAVVHAAAIALERTASRDDAEALSAWLARAPSALRPSVLRALVHADPARATPALASALASEDRVLRAAAHALVESADVPDPGWVPLLAKLLAADSDEATASALARVADGRGMPALLALAARTPDAAQRCARAIALGVRRFGDDLGRDTHTRALALLHSLPPGERRLSLCALARDGAALHFAIAGLSAPDPQRRATAAGAVASLGDARALPALSAALARESDFEAVRRMSEAAFALGASVSPRVSSRWLREPETAPEMMTLVAERARAAPPVSLRVLLRRELSSSPVARVRAAAALALARIGDAGAVPALSAALADVAPPVRLAAVRALSSLGGDAAARVLHMHARFERDPRVQSVARAQTASGGQPAPLTPRGALALEVRLRARGQAEPRPFVDVLLPDGRWLRMRAQAGSELIVPDLPAGDAEVRALD